MATSRATLESLLHSAYRYAHALCAHAEMAEDLVHESWLKVVDKHGPNPDKALLFRVIRNAFIDQARHRTRFPSDTFEEELMPDARSHDPSDYVSEDRVLSAGLAALREIDREVLFLWVFEGHTAAEIAELTEQSRGTVLSQIHRAKGKLRTHLEQHAQQTFKVVDAPRKEES